MGNRAEWICSDSDSCQYGKKLMDEGYEFYQIVPVGGDNGGDDFAVAHDIITVNESLVRYSTFIEKYLKPYGYSGVDELRTTYREAWPRIVAECIFETKSCLNSENYVRYGTYEFCEGYIAAKIETR